MTHLPRSFARRTAPVGIAAVVTLALVGCTGSSQEPAGDQSSSASATGSGSASASPSEGTGAQDPAGFSLPDGVSLEEPGSELSLGESATVAVEPNRARGSALTLTVDEIRAGRTADLNSYVLSDRAKSANPFYVDVTVENEGPGDLGGYAVPLFGQFDDTALVENTTFATPFSTCPSTGLPNQFGPGESVTRCLVFLVPDGGDLQGVAFARAGSDPIAWSGSITPASSNGNNGGGNNGGNNGGGNNNGGNGGGGGGNG